MSFARIIKRAVTKDARAAAKRAKRENDRDVQRQIFLRQHYDFVVQNHREAMRQAERPRDGAKRAA